jgi:hypothetical protein
MEHQETAGIPVGSLDYKILFEFVTMFYCGVSINVGCCFLFSLEFLTVVFALPNKLDVLIPKCRTSVCFLFVV